MMAEDRSVMQFNSLSVLVVRSFVLIIAFSVDLKCELYGVIEDV